jgi:hypothetical protein
MLELRRCLLPAGDLWVDDAVKATRRRWNEEMKRDWGSRLRPLSNRFQQLLAGCSAIGDDEHASDPGHGGFPYSL